MVEGVKMAPVDWVVVVNSDVGVGETVDDTCGVAGCCDVWIEGCGSRTRLFLRVGVVVVLLLPPPSSLSVMGAGW